MVAPYASVLALSVDPQGALENIRRMLEMGWADDQGFFEAADFDAYRLPEGAVYRLVKSHMAHHQGMILCALCNVLEHNALVRAFMTPAAPRANAYWRLHGKTMVTRLPVCFHLGHRAPTP